MSVSLDRLIINADNQNKRTSHIEQHILKNNKHGLVS